MILFRFIGAKVELDFNSLHTGQWLGLQKTTKIDPESGNIVSLIGDAY
jgi:hypothetical protein